ncbi:MAG: hypothetical protein ACRDOU_22350 [Streptosporangiaceae bacterium]
MSRYGHTVEILREAGLDGPEIISLLDDGVASGTRHANRDDRVGG